MSWAQRRKTTYIFSILLFFAIIFAIILFSIFNTAPTCFDGIQNQNETGIDCGGPCNLLCRAAYSNPVVIWGPRWEKINGVYNFLTYAQNPNIGVGAKDVVYLFKVYDKDGVLLYQKNGTTIIPANNNFVIFENSVDFNDKIPVRAEFDFTKNITWEKMEATQSSIVVVSKNLTDDVEPKLLVTLSNSTHKSISNIESVAILYDENNNAVAFSKTKTDSISAGGTSDIVFTWPGKFESKIVRIDIVSRVLPEH